MFISVIFITAKSGDESNVHELRKHGELTEWTPPGHYKGPAGEPFNMRNWI